jgi:hypothetical protein
VCSVKAFSARALRAAYSAYVLFTTSLLITVWRCGMRHQPERERIINEVRFGFSKAILSHVLIARIGLA